jgi:hypothetical protein
MPLPDKALQLPTLVRALHRDEIRTAAHALAYLTDCSLASVEHFVLKSKPPVGAYRKAVGQAQFGVDKCRALATLGAGRAADILVDNTSVDAWAGALQRPVRVEPLGALAIGEDIEGTEDAQVFLTRAELDTVKALARRPSRPASEYRRHISIAQARVTACCGILGIKPGAFCMPDLSVKAWAKSLEVPAAKRARPLRPKAGQEAA